MKKHSWIFLRGLGRNSDHWGPFVDRFKATFPDADVELLDLRGNGSLSHSPSYLSIEDNVRDLRARSRFLKEGRSVRLLSISLGAMVAVEWARQFADEIEEVVLINTSERGTSKFWQRLQPRNYPKFLTLWSLGQTSEKAEHEILRMTSQLADKKKWATVFSQSSVTKRGNFLRQLIAASRYEFPRQKPKTDVLILNSAKDRMVSPVCSQNIAELWHLKIHTHPEAGHDLPLDAPDWICEQISSWQNCV
jgi:pimeloyl-ACP methyl ester carboxylesterase